MIQIDEKQAKLLKKFTVFEVGTIMKKVLNDDNFDRALKESRDLDDRQQIREAKKLWGIVKDWKGEQEIDEKQAKLLKKFILYELGLIIEAGIIGGWGGGCLNDAVFDRFLDSNDDYLEVKKVWEIVKDWKVK